ncbi:unnamed protein product [marine sediment metagenome]|uniref:Uncharacterized protein n=1 Tax=marine sediment metagenome TaxID=412755 RepID=X1HGL2_9ZZZZ
MWTFRVERIIQSFTTNRVHNSDIMHAIVPKVYVSIDSPTDRYMVNNDIIYITNTRNAQGVPVVRRRSINGITNSNSNMLYEDIVSCYD